MLWRLLVICGLISFGAQVVRTEEAEAAILDWPVVKQAVQVGTCVVADAGAIGQSVVKHLVGFSVDLLTIVKDCAVFVVDAVTPDRVDATHSHP